MVVKAKAHTKGGPRRRPGHGPSWGRRIFVFHCFFFFSLYVFVSSVPYPARPFFLFFSRSWELQQDGRGPRPTSQCVHLTGVFLQSARVSAWHVYLLRTCPGLATWYFFPPAGQEVLLQVMSLVAKLFHLPAYQCAGNLLRQPLLCCQPFRGALMAALHIPCVCFFSEFFIGQIPVSAKLRPCIKGSRVPMCSSKRQAPKTILKHLRTCKPCKPCNTSVLGSSSDRFSVYHCPMLSVQLAVLELTSLSASS